MKISSAPKDLTTYFRVYNLAVRRASIQNVRVTQTAATLFPWGYIAIVYLDHWLTPLSCHTKRNGNKLLPVFPENSSTMEFWRCHKAYIIVMYRILTTPIWMVPLTDPRATRKIFVNVLGKTWTVQVQHLALWSFRRYVKSNLLSNHGTGNSHKHNNFDIYLMLRRVRESFSGGRIYISSTYQNQLYDDPW